jgi:translation initiation factor 3 subunit L
MYYYVGFAYMMMRRYADAIRTFSNILLYIQRTRGLFQVRNYALYQMGAPVENLKVLSRPNFQLLFRHFRFMIK